MKTEEMLISLAIVLAALILYDKVIKGLVSKL
jgi:hypothetical protein